MPHTRTDHDSVHESVATRMRSIISIAEHEWGNSTIGITNILKWTWDHLLLQQEEGMTHSFDVLTAHGWDVQKSTTIICAALLEEHFLSIHESLQGERPAMDDVNSPPLWATLPGKTDHDRRASALIAADLCAVMSSSLISGLDAPARIRVAGLHALSDGVMSRSIDGLQSIIGTPEKPQKSPRLLDRLVHAMTDSTLLSASNKQAVPPEQLS